MISCIVFNCAGVNSYDPMRIAGTWKQYSKKAMPQLTTTTFHSASPRNRKCPYQATVMKMFEIVSSRIVLIPLGYPSLCALSASQALGRKRTSASCIEQTPSRILHTCPEAPILLLPPHPFSLETLDRHWWGFFVQAIPEKGARASRTSCFSRGFFSQLKLTGPVLVSKPPPSAEVDAC